MRKILFSLVIVLVIASSGCTFFWQKEEVPVAPPVEVQLEKKVGLVSTPTEQGLLTAPSQFVLVTDLGEKVFLDSVSVNLKRYTKRRIEVEGKWNDGRTVFMVDNSTSLGHETETKQSYMDTEMGIKFQYPSVWILKNEKNIAGQQKIIITPYDVTESELPSVDNIIVERSENNHKQTARLWLNLDDQYRSKDPLETNITYQQSIVGVAQLEGVKKTFGSGDKVEFYVPRDTFMYRFTHTTVNDADKDLYRNAFFNIVASFEFVPFMAGQATAGITTTPEKLEIKPEVKLPDASLSDLAEKELAARKEAEAAAAAKKAEQDALVANQGIKQTLIDYIKQNISTLAPEAAANGSWSVSTVEFAYPEGKPEEYNAVYVIYRDSKDSRKILLNIPDKLSPSSMVRVAYFKPGSVSDWELADGTDSAKSSEKAVVPVSTGGLAVTVKKGMRLLESRTFGISIQYPSNYYWAFEGGAYCFGGAPIKADTVCTVSLLKNPAVDKLAPSMVSDGEVGGRPATSGSVTRAGVFEEYDVCVQARDKYCLAVNSGLVSAAAAKDMLSTIVEPQ